MALLLDDPQIRKTREGQKGKKEVSEQKRKDKEKKLDSDNDKSREEEEEEDPQII